MFRLPPNDCARRRRRWVVRGDELEQLRRGRQRGEWIPQLVRKHRKKFVLRSVGRDQRLFLTRNRTPSFLHRTRELRYLVDLHDGRSYPRLATRHGLRGVRQSGNWLRDAPAEHKGECNCDSERKRRTTHHCQRRPP